MKLTFNHIRLHGKQLVNKIFNNLIYRYIHVLNLKIQYL